MIRHVTLFAWVPKAADEQKQQVVEDFQALPPLLSGLCAYHVGPDAGIIEGNFDFAVVADFEDAESYLAYRNHPAHRAVVEQVTAPITKQRVSVQYEI
jgi:quinol monooxygenase YgiN